MNPYATGILHDNPLRIDALYGCPHVLPKEHTFNFITPRYLRIENKNLMEPLYLRGHYLSSDEERKNIKKIMINGELVIEWKKEKSIKDVVVENICYD